MSTAGLGPLVGVGVLLCKRNSDGGVQVLLGKRKGSHGAGQYALPGGHLEYGETLQDCAARELEEETGIIVPPAAITHCHTTSDLIPAAAKDGVEVLKHYVTVFMRAEVAEGTTAETKEPHKCEGWLWVSYPGEVPAPRFKPLQTLLDSGISILPS